MSMKAIFKEKLSNHYKGDHYQYIVRTEDEDDFVVDNEWTWNENDIVSVKISPNKIKMKLKGDIKAYEI